MKHVAITGIGGFIGLRLAERVRERGVFVTGLELSEAAAARARQRGFVTVVGDVNDPSAVRAAVVGADVVVHTAAVVEEGGDLARFRRVNVEGTRSVAGVARASGVRTFVQLSSVMVYGFSYPPNVDEDEPLRGEGNAYCETKIESEAAVRAFHDERMGVIVIRPGDVYGAGSVPWVTRPLELMRKGLFHLPDGGRGVMNHVHVDNLVDAVFEALDRGVVGETLAITDGVATSAVDFFGYHARMLGKGHASTLPTPVLRTMVGAVERVSLALGRTPPARVAALDYLSRPHGYGIGRARRVLGYAPRVDLRSGMRAIAAELRLLDPSRSEALARTTGRLSFLPWR